MTWTSPRPPIEADDATLPELVLEAARRAPERAGLVDGTSGAAISFATLAARGERLAAALAARGFGPGDTLALWAPNLPPWAGVALAAMRAGGAVTGVNPAAGERELAAQLADADVAVIPRPDDRYGEVPVAFVVPRGALDRDALMDWVAARVAPHKRLRAVRLADRIPRTPAGKILRRELIERDRAAARPPAAGAAVTAPRATPAGAPGSA